MDNTRIYQAKRPLEITQLICISICTGVWGFNIISDGWNTYLAVACFAGMLVIEGILIYQAITARTYFEIKINPESIAVKDRIIEASDIKTVFVKGYFMPVIGIRPKGNLLVPYKYCFRFASDTDIKNLTAWAEQKQIAVSRKGFKRWH